MARIVDQNLEKRAEHRSARSQETLPDVDQTAPAGSAEHDAPIAADCLDSELPDIIDVVLEMGRTPEEPPAEAGAPSPPLPVVSTPRLPAHLDALADRARDYAEAASSANTRRGQPTGKQFASWCRRQGVEMFPPDPRWSDSTSPPALERRAATRRPFRVDDRAPPPALTWNYTQRASCWTEKTATSPPSWLHPQQTRRPPRQKRCCRNPTRNAGSRQMRGLRDRAMLLIGFAGGLRRSVVGLDCGRDQTEDPGCGNSR